MNVKTIVFSAIIALVAVTPTSSTAQSTSARIRVKVEVARLPADIKMQIESALRGALRSLGDVDLVDGQQDVTFGVGPAGVSGSGTNTIPLQIHCTRPFASLPAARRLAQRLGTEAQQVIAEETKDISVYLHAGTWPMPKGQTKSFAEQLVAGFDVETLEQIRKEKAATDASLGGTSASSNTVIRR